MSRPRGGLPAAKRRTGSGPEAGAPAGGAEHHHRHTPSDAAPPGAGARGGETTASAATPDPASGPVTPPFRVPVLMYHHVEPELPADARHPDSYVTVDELDAHLALLRRRRFHLLTLAEAARRVGEGQKLPPRPVVLTFDDGCRCFAEHALPVLRRHGAPATLFAVSGELGGHNRWDAADGPGTGGGRPGESGAGSGTESATGTGTGAGERREELLDAAGLGEMAAAGIEIGSHGATHLDLSGADLSRPLDAATLERETTGSRAALEEALGRPVETFCYPYGRTSPPAVAAVRKAGYRAAVAIHGHAGAVAGHPWAVPRQIVRPGEGSFELWLKARGLYPAWSRLPRLGLLRALRRNRPKEIR